MIARRFLFQIYDLFVHVADSGMPTAQPFITMYKYGRTHPETAWSTYEKDIAARALREGLANPRRPTDGIYPLILPNQ